MRAIFKSLSLLCLGIAIGACSDEHADHSGSSSQTSLSPPGIDSLSRSIDIDSLQARIILTVNGVAEEFQAQPIGARDGIWTSTFLVPQGSPFLIRSIWSAVGVDGHRVEYAELEKVFAGIDQNTVIDATQDSYNLSAERFDSDGDGGSNFTELSDGTPAALRPIAYYPFDNGAALDLSGNNQHGEVSGAVPAMNQNGVADTALRIGRSTDRILLPNTIFNGLGNFTFLVRVSFDDFNVGRNQANVLLSVATALNDNELTFGYALNETGVPLRQQFYVNVNGGSLLPFAPTDQVRSLAWHCIALYRNGVAAGVVIDGAVVGNEISVPGAAISSDAGGVVIGQDQDSLGGSFQVEQSLVGSIDELFLFDRVLSAEEMQRLCR